MKSSFHHFWRATLKQIKKFFFGRWKSNFNVINTIRKNKKRPDKTSIYEFLNKNLENANLTKITINKRLTSMSNNNGITKKLTNGKISYSATNNESSKPNEVGENHLLTNIETLPPKNIQLPIFRISWKTYRTSSPWTFARKSRNKKCYA